MKAGKHKKGRQTGYDFCWKVLDTAHLFFMLTNNVWIYVIAILLLVSYISTPNHLLYFARFCLGSTPKYPTKTYNKELCHVS